MDPAASSERGSMQNSFADPHNFDADPDPTFHFDADPDPDPAYHFDADPDPTFQFAMDPCGSGSTTLNAAFFVSRLVRYLSGHF